MLASKEQLFAELNTDNRLWLNVLAATFSYFIAMI